MNTGATQELPRYKSHKTVWALKIKAITIVPGGDENNINWYLHPDDIGYGPVAVTNEWRIKFAPQAGGYYVQYKDGYASYSPATAFEEGNTPDTGTHAPAIKEVSTHDLVQELSERAEVFTFNNVIKDSIKAIGKWFTDHKAASLIADAAMKQLEEDRRK